MEPIESETAKFNRITLVCHTIAHAKDLGEFQTGTKTNIRHVFVDALWDRLHIKHISKTKLHRVAVNALVREQLERLWFLRYCISL